MKAPQFWTEPPGLRSALLAPFAAIWTASTRRRLARTGEDIGLPVICVGNLNVGGTGKTPLVMDLCQRLADHAPHVVSRGYGGAEKGPLQVDAARHTAARVGDEPLLLSAFGPVWVAEDRVKGAKAAKDAGAKTVVLDDGFQNPSLAKTASILVIDAAVGFGNGRVIPAGPLREPIADGLARADLAVVIGAPEHRRTFLAAHSLPCAVAEAELKPLPTGMDWKNLKVLAFAGIGRPEKFFDTIKTAGAEIISKRAFGDHAPYRADLLKRLLAEAQAKGAQLVTTEKDAVRLPSEFRPNVLTFPVRLQFADDTALKDLIEKTVQM